MSVLMNMRKKLSLYIHHIHLNPLKAKMVKTPDEHDWSNRGSTMHNTNRHESICRQLISVTVFLVLLTTGLWISEGLVVWAGDEESVYGDKAGREAFRLWTEKERDRAMAEAASRYWDYWLSHPSRHYSGYRLRLELESTQRWLKDPEHNPPPPLSP